MDTEDKLQKQILKRLEKINEQWLDNDDYERRMKKSKLGKRKFESSQTDTGFTGSQEPQSRRKKKKKRKCKQMECVDNVTTEVIPETKTVKGEKKHLQDLKLSLGLTECDIKSKLCENSSQEIKTKSNHKGPEVVIYNAPGKKKQQKQVVNEQESSSNKMENIAEDQPEFDLKKARFEVQKVGIKGFSGSAKEDAMTSYLVKLGAKLPKNKSYNYKEFLELRKKEKELAKEKKAVDRGLGYKVKNSRQEKKRSKNRNDIGVLDGQVGRYKDGVQYVNKKDLKGFNRKKRR